MISLAEGRRSETCRFKVCLTSKVKSTFFVQWQREKSVSWENLKEQNPMSSDLTSPPRDTKHSSRNIHTNICFPMIQTLCFKVCSRWSEPEPPQPNPENMSRNNPDLFCASQETVFWILISVLGSWLFSDPIQQWLTVTLRHRTGLEAAAFHRRQTLPILRHKHSRGPQNTNSLLSNGSKRDVFTTRFWINVFIF